MVLLLSTVALLVARPLVPGEDPAFLSSLTDPGGPTPTFLWFLLAAAWALRAVLTRQSALAMGWVDCGLLALAGVYFLSAEFAPAIYPARLTAWEMLGMAACFLSMRQAARSQEELKPLWNALLATAFCVSLYGLYQHAWEMPALRKQYEGNLQKLKEDFAKQNPGMVELDEAFLGQLKDRVLQPHIFSTYSHPNSLASFLVLLAPSFVLAAVAAFRHPYPRRALAFTLTLLASYCLAIWFNFSRGGMGALGITALGWGAWHAWKNPPWRKWVFSAVGAGLLLAAGIWQAGFLDSLWTKEGSGGMKARVEHWQGTWRMIQAKPWLGVGPGNFGNFYTSFMNPATEEKIKDPHNFILELWSNAGATAPLIFLCVLACLFYALCKKPNQVDSPPGVQEVVNPIPPWIFYLGGMFGLLLGFVLRVEYRSTNDLISECIGALIRTAGWFFAFGILENLSTSKREQVMALALGLVAMLINLCLSGSVLFSSVMIPFWACAALALNASLPAGQFRGIKPAWGFPFIAGVTALYAFAVFIPLATAHGLALQASREGHSPGMDLGQKTIRGMDRVGHLLNRVVGPYLEAARLEPLNPRWPLGLATWYPVVFVEATRRGDPNALAYGNAALAAVEQAEKLDPQSTETALARYHLRSFFAERNKKEAARQYRDAAQGLNQAIQKDPYEAKWHYLLADTLVQALKADPNSKDKGTFQGEIKKHSAEALRLDAQFQAPMRKLTPPERIKALEWKAGKVLPTPK
ncbi:MAG: hypothetical protein EXR99_09920 [Gemmataceae bacterium]|nr:hypothetical protein [Gemmataceae bacterium]